MDTIRHVVVAVIVRDHRLLLTQRRPSKSFPFRWECPGGKVEPNEPHQAALARELREELGVVARIGEVVVSAVLDPPICMSLTQIGFYRVIIEGAPLPLEAAGLGWFTVSEFTGLDMTPGNKHIWKVLRDEVLG